MAKSIIMVSMKAMPKPTNHPLDAGRVSTMALIFSVTVPKVWPGSMTGARSSGGIVDLYCSFMRSKSVESASMHVLNLCSVAPPGLLVFLLLVPRLAP